MKTSLQLLSTSNARFAHEKIKSELNNNVLIYAIINPYTEIYY